MKPLDLQNGFLRVLQSLSRPSTQCARCRRVQVARPDFNRAVSRRPFSSAVRRRAEDEPPRNTAGSKDAVEIAETEALGDQSAADDALSGIKAAPEIEGLMEDDDGQYDGISSTADGTSFRTAVASVSPSKKASATVQQGGRPQYNREFEEELLGRCRIVPASPSYFTACPNFTDHYLEILVLFRKHQLLPRLMHGQKSGQVQTRITWLDLAEYKELVGQEPIAAKQYKDLIGMCRNLAKINPKLMPDEVQDKLARFMKEELPAVSFRRDVPIDEHGRSYGLGRRKEATARAWIVRGGGEVLVNGKSLTEYFPRAHQRQSAIYALSVTERVGDYNVFAIVTGGGNTGQAEALTLAVAKALRRYEPELTNKLQTAGCLTRDRRSVERKKPGHVKARKMPTWVKR